MNPLNSSETEVQIIPADPSSEPDHNVPGHSVGAPEELPPVEPPSARFIAQLFLVPALIVVAVIGVWALFGSIVSGDQDWSKLVEDMKSTNPHRRWRAAHGLAHLLQSSSQENAEDYANNRQIAVSLSEIFMEQLDKNEPVENRNSTSGSDSAPQQHLKEHLNQQRFLTASLGYSDIHDVVLPPLQRATEEEFPPETRRLAIASLTRIAGRAWDRDVPITDQNCVEQMISLTRDSDELIREMSTYSLGVLQSSDVTERLKQLLDDDNKIVRVNAATGLARRRETTGFPVFREVLKGANQTKGKDFSGRSQRSTAFGT